jgi:hypothetical protein
MPVPGPGPAAGGGARARGGFGVADPGRGRPHCRDLSVRGPARVGRLPRRERERGGQLRSPLPERQPAHAASTQPGDQRRRESQRHRLRDPLSPVGAAPRAPPNNRRDRSPTVPPDLEDPAPGRPVRGTRPNPQPTVQAISDGQNDPATPKLRLSGRTGERPVGSRSHVTPGFSTLKALRRQGVACRATVGSRDT